MSVLYKTGDILHSDDELILVESSCSGIRDIDSPIHKAIIDKWGIALDTYNYALRQGLYQGDVVFCRIDSDKMLAFLVTRLDMLMPQHKEHTLYFLDKCLKKIAKTEPKTAATYKFASDMPWEEIVPMLEAELPQTQINIYVY